MIQIQPALDYLWSRLPLILLFGQGYVIYRLLTVTGLAGAFVLRSLDKSRGRPGPLLFNVATATALLSFFIPNAVTMLTVLPALMGIDRKLRAKGIALTTPLALMAIYGANIGGMGSLIGSPANLILIGALDLFAVDGRERITFFNWFLWSIPLVALFLSIGWAMVMAAMVPRMKLPDTGEHKAASSLDHRQKSGLAVFAGFIVFWILQAVGKEILPGLGNGEQWACVIFSLVFLGAVFAPNVFGPPPLLRLPDMVRGFPKKGILMLALLGVVIVLARWTGLDTRAAESLGRFMDFTGYLPMVYLSLLLTVMFLTEILSNTVVSAAFFAVAHTAAVAHGLDPLYLMLGVSLASTCAFMTPIATPCNALAFGEMRGLNLAWMLGLGLFMNLFCAFVMAWWLMWVIPLVYS